MNTHSHNLQRLHEEAAVEARRQVSRYQQRRYVAKVRARAPEDAQGQSLIYWVVYDTRKGIDYITARSQADAVRIALHKNLSC